MSHLAQRWFPSNTSSVSFECYARWRANEGVGPYVSFTGSPISVPDLAVYATRDTGAPLDLFVERAIRHLMDHGLAGWYNPEAVPVEEALRSAFSQWTPPRDPSSQGLYVYVFFDGQFGPVYVT